MGLKHSVQKTSIEYLNLINLRNAYEKSQNQLAEIQTANLRLHDIQKENDRLRKLLDFKTQSQRPLVAGLVLSHDFLDNRHTLLINRGRKDGLQLFNGVITPDGVVGYVSSLYPKQARIIILHDRYAVVDSLVERTRARAISEGAGPNKLKLLNLKFYDDVRVGDNIVTSGFDPNFPKGIPLGVVTQVKPDPKGVSQIVQLKPLIQSHKIEEVFIIL